MKRSFGKELLAQLIPASAAVVTCPVWLAIPAWPNASFPQAYLFYFVLSIPAFFVFGVPLAGTIEWAKRRAGAGGAGAYLASLPAYAAAGAAAMYVYLATFLAGLRIHDSPDVAGLLAVGAGAALYMYHLSLLLSYVRRRRAGAGTPG